MKRTSIIAAVALAVVFVASGTAHAVDLFGVEVTYSGGTITESASSLPDLIDALVNNQDAFAPLVGNDFIGSLTYYGIPDAITVEVVGDTQLTITSTLTDLDRTFTGTDRDDLEQQLTDWLLEEGGTEVAKLIQAAAENSVAAITDGNPSSATARMADRAFNTFGLYPIHRGGSVPSGHSGIWFHARKSDADTPIGTVDGTDYEVHLPWWINLSDRISLIGNLSGQYMDSEGSTIYGGGGDLGLGIRPVVRDASSKFGWQITPFVGLHAVGTYDGAVAGLLDQFGVSNRFEFTLGHGVIIAVASQYSCFDSLEIKIEDVEIDPELSQQVVKNGVLVDFPLGSGGKLFGNGFAVDTRFLDDAAIDNYQTLGGGLTLRGKSTSLNAYISRDFASDYSSWNAGVGLYFGL